MFLPGVDLLLAGQHLQISADPLASSRRLDDVVHKTLNKRMVTLERNVLNVFTHKDESLGYSFTSDSSWERVGELVHVFSFCLRLVLLSSEDNLNSTLRGKETVHIYCQKQKERETKKERMKVFVPWHP